MENKRGLEKWILDYKNNIKTEDHLQMEVNDFMNSYDLKENNAPSGEESVTDDWTVVAGNGKRAGFKQNESVVQRLEKKVQNDMEKALPSFYAKQSREFKKHNLIKLKKKYAEDKRKIENIKQKRTFKPF